MTTSTLDQVRQIVSRQSGVRLEKLTAQSAIDQDIGMSGDDVTELAEALAQQFGDHVWQWPWQRFAELSEPHLFTVFWLVWRLLSRPLRGHLLDPLERLELGHITAVIDCGEWFEP